MTDHLSFTSAYMDVIHDEAELLNRAQEHLDGVEFDTFVGTGISGTVAALRLSRMMDKRYLLVRKPNDGTHSSKSAEGTLGKRWVFVDDLVASGRTLVRVWGKVKSYNNLVFKSEFAGVFLYGNEFDLPRFVLPEELSDTGGYAEGWPEMMDRIRGGESQRTPSRGGWGMGSCDFGLPGCTCSA
ncbi:phosphoribosyltransferase [Mycobacteroides salmoniphilum]|uniref:phosphoribosyltransferase n=1 Tax=Mycobacteroides salmoniphilum TaxID=404941 RepID=UPI00099373BA|nr:phosphoribosyltransferase [Mycobacteroides salmoniphilum]